MTLSPLDGRPTLLRVQGRDALDVLHRISTQSLTDLRPGEVRPTLFCDFRGRLLHRTAVALDSDGWVWLMRDDAPPEELIAHVDRHVFREDVKVTDAGQGFALEPVEGGFGHVSGTIVERDGMVVEFQLDQDFGVRVVKALEVVSAPEPERARILAGRPRHGHEVEASFNPFEVGLAHEIHLSKGCFTGQEALMRMVTYRGVRRRLVRLGGSGDVPGVPADVKVAGAVVGRITSAAPTTVGWIGLAVLKHDAVAPDVALEIEGGGAIESAVPFAETRPLGLP